MSAERLLAYYERVADAPDAIARLRGLVLTLAVRGRLVRQDAGDEPASALLLRISVAKRRASAGPVAPNGSEPQIPEPFSVPAGWTWSTVGAVCSKTGSGSTPRGGKEVYKKNGVIFLRSQNVHDAGLRLDDVVRVDPGTHARMSGTSVRPGDLLLNITGGSIGRCCTVPDDLGEANVSQHVAIIRPAIDGMQEFLHMLFRSPFFQAFVTQEQTGAGRGGLPKNRMDRIPVVLPPLAEQHRIVKKVGELMVLCDQIEVERAAREDARDKFVAAVMSGITDEGTPLTSLENAARLALENVGVLTSRRDQVPLLRQVILTLAVRGRLVQQDSVEGTAADTLCAAKRARDALTTAGEIKEAYDLDPIAPAAGHDPLPASWQWAHFQDVAAVQSDLVSPFDHPALPLVAPDNIEAGTGRLLAFDSTAAAAVTSAKHRFHAGALLYSKIRPALNKVASVDFDGLCSADMYPIRPFINRRFLQLLMLSEVFVAQAVDVANRVAMPKINQQALARILVPVAPLAEQQRIVERFNALMTACDQLEASLATSENCRLRLLDSLIAGAA